VEEPASSPSVTAPAPQPEEASTPASAAKSDVEEPKAAPSPVEEPAPSPAVTAPVERRNRSLLGNPRPIPWCNERRSLTALRS
jgi:hypothetical protein